MMGERVAVNEDGGIFSLFESVSEAMTCFVGFGKTLGILEVLFGFPGVEVFTVPHKIRSDQIRIGQNMIRSGQNFGITLPAK